MMKISVVGILVVAMMVGLLSGCGLEDARDEGTVTEPEVKVINVMHRFPPEPEPELMGNLIIHMIESFEAQNPDIKVIADSVPSSMYESQLTVRLAAEEGPDIYMLWPGGRAESQLRKGDILDVTDVWEDNHLFDLFKQGVVNGSTHTDGQIYTLPIEYKPNTFWYNAKIFDDLGIEVPETWDDLMAVAQTCKEAGYVPFAVGGKLTRWMPAFWFDYLLLNTAGGDFRERLMWGMESWESPQVYHVFELWKEALDQGYFNDNFKEADSKEAIRMVGNGEAVMMLQGPWTINDLMLQGKIPEVDFNLFPFPQVDPDVPQAAEGAIIAWAVNPNSEALEASKRFIAFMADYEAAEYLASKRNTLGPRKDIGYDIYTSETRSMMEGLGQITDEATLYMNFELATLPPIQDAGMEAIIEFMANPEDYKAICARMEAISRATFD